LMAERQLREQRQVRAIVPAGAPVELRDVKNVEISAVCCPQYCRPGEPVQ